MTVSDAWTLALAQQASTIRRYIIWRRNHACDEGFRRVVDRANGEEWTPPALHDRQG
jgi:hypothetical protein